MQVNILEAVLKLVSKLPPEGLTLVVKLLNTLFNSDDPMRAVKRATIAAASEKASDAVLRKRLGG